MLNEIFDQFMEMVMTALTLLRTNNSSVNENLF